MRFPILRAKAALRVLARFRTVASLIGLRVGGAFAAFVLTVILARVMSQADMGRAMSLMSFSILLAIAVAGGMESGAVRFVARYRESRQISQMRGFLDLSRLIPLVLGGVCGLFAAAMLLMGGPTPIALALLAAALLGQLRVGAAHALAFGHITASLAPATVLRQCFLLVAIFALSRVFETLSVTNVLLSFVAANACALAVQALLNRGIRSEAEEHVSDWSHWREWAEYGFHMAPTLLFVQYSRDLTLILSALILPPADVAVLGVATALTAFAKFAVAAVNQSITPSLARLIAQSDRDGLVELIHGTNHTKVWMTVAGIVLLIPLGDPLLGLFGDNFRDGTPILMILMIEPLALAFFGPGGQYLGLSGHQRVMNPMAVFALISMTVCIIGGAWLAGLQGAAIGVASSWILWTSALAILARRTSGFDLSMIGTLRRLIGTRQ